jgi:hypothetical protein
MRSTKETTVKVEKVSAVCWYGNVCIDFQKRSSANWPLASPSASDLTRREALKGWEAPYCHTCIPTFLNHKLYTLSQEPESLIFTLEPQTLNPKLYPTLRRCHEGGISIRNAGTWYLATPNLMP